MTAKTTGPTGYTGTQIALHWIVAALIVFQIVAHDGIEHAWRAFEGRGEATATDMAMAYAHIAAGIAVLVFRHLLGAI